MTCVVVREELKIEKVDREVNEEVFRELIGVDQYSEHDIIR